MIDDRPSSIWHRVEAKVDALAADVTVLKAQVALLSGKVDALVADVATLKRVVEMKPPSNWAWLFPFGKGRS